MQVRHFLSESPLDIIQLFWSQICHHLNSVRIVVCPPATLCRVALGLQHCFLVYSQITSRM